MDILERPDELNTSGYKIIVIRHRLEGKGSKFLSGFFKSLFNQTLGIDAEIDITDYSVKIKISLAE